MGKKAKKALRIVSTGAILVSTSIQNVDATQAIVDNFKASSSAAIACGIVDAAEFYALQGPVISNGSLKARPDEYINLDEIGRVAPPPMVLKAASRAVVQPINLGVSLFNAACDRYFLLSSLAAMIRDLANIPAPLSGIETGGAFWGVCIVSILIAFANRMAADSYAVGKRLAEKIERDPTALPIQAFLLRLLTGKRLSLFKALCNGESSVMDDTVPVAMLPYVILQFFKLAEKDPVLKAGISIGLGSALMALALATSLPRSIFFDGSAINQNVRESHYLSPLEDRIQNISKCQYRSLQLLLGAGSLFNGLNMGASTILAMYNQLDHFFDQLPEDYQSPIRLLVYSIVFLGLATIGCISNQYSEVLVAEKAFAIKQTDEDEDELQHIIDIPNPI